MGNNVILRLLSGKRKSGSLDDMCGIMWQIIFIMLNIYTSSRVLQLGIILPLCTTLCVETKGKMILWQIFLWPHILLLASCLEIGETRRNKLRSHFIWAIQPCCDSAADRTTRTDYQGQHLVRVPPRKTSQWLPVID